MGKLRVQVQYVNKEGFKQLMAAFDPQRLSAALLGQGYAVVRCVFNIAGSGKFPDHLSNTWG